MNISIIYIYPKIIEINNDINLFRIIDNNIKESIVAYATKENNIYKIMFTNTFTGEIDNIISLENINDIEIMVNNIQSKEKEIKEINDLNNIYKYILKMYKI